MSDTSEDKVVRTQATGDKIFLLREGKRLWIRNPETLHGLGFEFGQEVEITPKELYEYEDGGSINLVESETGGDAKLKVTQAHTPGPILNYRRTV